MTTLLVASAGGHVEELALLRHQLGLGDSVQWVTCPTDQTRSLLRDETVHWMRHVGSGSYPAAIRAFPAALELHRRLRPSLLVTTGALAAVPHILAASLEGCPVWYVESATRRRGPSKTGRLAGRIPRARLLAQGDGWGDPRWEPIPDVFTNFDSLPSQRVGGRPRRVLVSLGTEHFPFTRAVRRLESLLDGCEVTWQTGSTRVERDGQLLSQWLPADELRAACESADVVITHAGVGSALMALSAGKVPVLLPRRAELGEHVDNHQTDFGAYLSDRRLAVSVDPDELTWTHLQAAFERVATRRTAETAARAGRAAVLPGQRQPVHDLPASVVGPAAFTAGARTASRG